MNPAAGFAAWGAHASPPLCLHLLAVSQGEPEVPGRGFESVDWEANNNHAHFPLHDRGAVAKPDRLPYLWKIILLIKKTHIKLDSLLDPPDIWPWIYNL